MDFEIAVMIRIFVMNLKKHLNPFTSYENFKHI